MNDPIRIKLSRTKGWRMPPNTVKVTRPSRWGNPFRIGGHFMVGDTGTGYGLRMSWCESLAPEPPKFTLIANAQMAVDFYRRLLANGYHKDFSELRGKNLACWCALGAPCHADVLLELANA
jgi:hypothetical protein